MKVRIEALFRNAIVLSMCFFAIVVVIGFTTTSVIRDGFLAAWSKQGLWNYLIFIASSSFLILGSNILTGKLDLLAIVIFIWLILIFGFAPLCALVYIFLSAYCIGSYFIRRFSNELPSRFSEIIINIVLGLATILSISQILVHFPVNYRITYLIILGIPIAFNLDIVRENILEIGGYLFNYRPDRQTFLYAVPLMVVLAVHSVYVALPEAFYDALVAHLTVPNQIAWWGKWDFDFRSNVCAVMPMGADWLYTVGYLVGGEFTARLINFGLFVITTLLIVDIVRKRAPVSLALLIGAVFATTPITFIESASLFVENALAMFLLAAFFLLITFWDRITKSSVLAISLCLGAALSIKLHAVAPVILISALLLFQCVRKYRQISVLSAFGIFLLIFVLTGLVPYFYSFYETGNPVFPFFNRLFGSPYYPNVNFEDARWTGKFGWSILYDMTFNSHLFGEVYDGCFGFQHLFLLPAGILTAIFVGNFSIRLAAIIAILYFFFITINAQYIRYIYPAFPFFTLTEVSPFIFLQSNRFLSVFPKIFLGILIILNLSFASTSCWILRNFDIMSIFDNYSKRLYLAKMVPERSLNEAVNNTTIENANVLYLSNPFGAGLNGVPIYSNWYNPTLASKLNLIKDYHEFVSLLQEYRVTHLMFTQSQIENVPYKKVLIELLMLNGTAISKLQDTYLYSIRLE